MSPQTQAVLRRRAKAERACTYRGDARGLRADHQAGRSYSPRGRTPTTSGTGKRFGANVLSAITDRGHLALMVFKTRFASSVFLRFLRRLVRQSTRRVFLIVDGHPVHKSAKTRRWLASNPAYIMVGIATNRAGYLGPPKLWQMQSLGRKTWRETNSGKRPPAEFEIAPIGRSGTAPPLPMPGASVACQDACQAAHCYCRRVVSAMRPGRLPGPTRCGHPGRRPDVARRRRHDGCPSCSNAALTPSALGRPVGP